jgi:thioredoxin-related protein
MRYLLLSLLLLCAMRATAAENDWLADWPAALHKAQIENKGVLLLFSGNDEFTQRLKEEVFNQAEFVAFAKTNLVLVEADLSGGKALSPELVAKNESLAAEFSVDGTPLVFILDKNGTRLEKGGYIPGGATNYIAALQKVRGLQWKPYLTNAVGTVVSPTNAAPPAPLFIAPVVVTYDDLYLKGISTGKMKTALINDKVLAEGEGATVKVAGKPVKIRCQEIRNDAVVIQVEGEAEVRELKFQKPPSPR